jgi:hypothetical protein
LLTCSWSAEAQAAVKSVSAALLAQAAAVLAGT